MKDSVDNRFLHSLLPGRKLEEDTALSRVRFIG